MQFMWCQNIVSLMLSWRIRFRIQTSIMFVELDPGMFGSSLVRIPGNPNRRPNLLIKWIIGAQLICLQLHTPFFCPSDHCISYILLSCWCFRFIVWNADRFFQDSTKAAYDSVNLHNIEADDFVTILLQSFSDRGHCATNCNNVPRRVS